MHGTPLPPVRTLRAVALLAAAVLTLGGSTRSSQVRPDPDDPKVPVPEVLRGRSGQLRSHIVPPREDSAAAEPLSRVFGEQAIHRAAVWMVRDSATGRPFHFITLRPFAEKQNGRVGAYAVGRWPGEVRRPLSEAYRPPDGFIEVTEENASLAISANFTLGDFLDRSQRAVWPKALVLDLRLVDKLELLRQELEILGHRNPDIGILSGFRTPQANARGQRSAQSTESRHLYGDAADIIVDSDGDGRMDDITKDGRVDERDILALIRLVELVEEKYPELVGGIGRYRAAGGSGMFLHVDVRGTRVRWGP
jgi:hypothetical protein